MVFIVFFLFYCNFSNSEHKSYQNLERVAIVKGSSQGFNNESNSYYFHYIALDSVKYLTNDSIMLEISRNYLDTNKTDTPVVSITFVRSSAYKDYGYNSLKWYEKKEAFIGRVILRGKSLDLIFEK